MKKLFVSLLLPLVFIGSSQGTPDWYSIGLDDRAVNCVLADDTSALIAGTDSGVSVRWNATWYHIKMLPVTALERVSTTLVAAAAGNGSKADGIYTGRRIINGPPFYSFTISNENCIVQPTALAVQPIITHAPGPTGVLYAANGTSVVSGLLMNDSLQTLNPIAVPAYAFGVEMPYCSSLHPFNDRVYAGGYDKSPMPSSSFLLSTGTASIDTMYTMRRMKTTAIAQGRFSSIIGSVSLDMAVADADSGVFFYDQSLDNPWYRIDGPAGSPIRSLFVLPVSESVNDNILYAANNDGVFQCKSGEPQPIWVKTGTLSAEPLYITGMGQTGDLLAATVKGVYQYGNQGTGVPLTFGSSAGAKTCGQRIVRVSGLFSPGMATGYTNLQGRSIGSKTFSGKKASGVVVTDIRK